MQSAFSTHFNQAWLNQLLQSPQQSHSGVFEQSPYQAKIVIPGYKQRIADHYREEIQRCFGQQNIHAGLANVFQHFGVELSFEKPVELKLHDQEMNMDSGLHPIIQQAGAIIIKNACLDSAHRSMGHRNRFPNLNFHIDRSSKQPTHYSLYTRDPFDPEQKQPRTSSTVFVETTVGYLQAVRQGILEANRTVVFGGSNTIFEQEDMNDLLGDIILQHAWDEPEGTGEISIIDNITCLHASYYPKVYEKGYKIGVRYVG